MSNTKPDLGSDPRVVALAKVLREAAMHDPGEVVGEGDEWKLWLPEAAAAITHIGSGYVLPEATEANAERLAKAMYGDLDQVGNRAMAIAAAGVWLSVLATAFADPAEKPEPIFLREDQMRPVEPEPSEDYLPRCTATLDGVRCKLAVHEDDSHDNGESSWCDQPSDPPLPEPAKPDPAREGELSATWAADADKHKLHERFMLALAGNPQWLLNQCQDLEAWAERTRKMADHFVEAVCKR